MSRVEVATGEHWSWVFTVLLGIGLVLWILVEVMLLPERTVIELLYGLVGLSLTGIAFLPSVRSYLARHG